MTLGFMHRLAVEGSKDLEVRSAAIEALDRFGARPHDPIAALGAVFGFVRDRIRFVGDPVGTQAVQSPRATLGLGAGNCAQRATLLAAMARSIGIPADLKFRVIAANPRAPRSFSHVYVVANVRGRQIPLDPTYRENPPGYEYPSHTRMGDFRP
jgi:transglutaminase-like putative cysteine protease